MLQDVMSKIAAVKKDMIILEKSEFSTLLAENEVSVFISCFPKNKCCIGSVNWFVLVISDSDMHLHHPLVTSANIGVD